MTALAHRTSRRSLFVAAALVGALALALLPAGPASAAPANDDIADAAPATVGWITADLAGATVEPGEPTVCTEYDPDFSSYTYGTDATVWYRYSVDVTATVRGNVYDYSGDGDATVHIFREVDGALESVTCSDSGVRADFRFQAKAGEEFLVQIGVQAGSPGDYDEAVVFTSLYPAVPNTGPSTAKKLAVPSSTTQSTQGTDFELSAPYGCNPADSALMNDVWYRITAPANGPLTIDATASDFRVTFAVYSPGDLSTPVACPPIGPYIDGYPGVQAAKVTFPAAAGQTFLVQVGGFYLDEGLVALTITQGTPAPPVIYTTAPASGPRGGGTAVTITGDRFTPDATVMFGALPATSVTYVSPTTLIAVTPRVPSQRLVEVHVTTPLGTSAKGIFAKFWYVG